MLCRWWTGDGVEGAGCEGVCGVPCVVLVVRFVMVLAGVVGGRGASEATEAASMVESSVRARAE